MTQAMAHPHKHRASSIFMLLLACFENFACGGLLFGWAAISSTMLRAPVEDGGAGLDRDYAHSIFVIGSTVNFMAPLLLGVILDVAGPRACSAISLLLVASGFVLFGMSDSTFPAFVPGMALIAFGGPGVQSSIIHISNLFPTSKSSATSLITGSFQLSFVVFLVFERLWDMYGWSYQLIFRAYAGVVLLCFFLSVFCMPDKPYSLKSELRHIIEDEPELAGQYEGKTERDFEIHKLRLPSVYRKAGYLQRAPSIAMYGRQSSGTRSPGMPSSPRSMTTASSTRSPGGTGSQRYGGNGSPGPSTPKAGRSPSITTSRSRSLKDETLWKQVASGKFWRCTLLLVAASFWANFYIGVIDTQLGDQAYLSPEALVSMTGLFTLITTLGVLGIPVVGYLMDNVGFPVTATVTVTLGVVYCAGVLVRGQEALLVAYCAYALFRTFLFTYFFGYLGDALGFRFFGVLSGITFALAGVVGLAQYPLSTYGTGDCHTADVDGCDHGKWQAVNYMQLATVLVLYLLPLFDLKSQKQPGAPPSPRLTVDSPIVSRKMLEGLQAAARDPSEMTALRSANSSKQHFGNSYQAVPGGGPRRSSEV